MFCYNRLLSYLTFTPKNYIYMKKLPRLSWICSTLTIVFRTLLKSVFAKFNRYVWLCVLIVPASPSLRVGVLKSPKCPVSFHKILYNRRVSRLYLIYSRVQKTDILCNLLIKNYTKLGRVP